MNDKGRIVALLVAAGSGSRAGANGDSIPKQYRRIAGRPLLRHALDRLTHPRIDEIRVVIGAGQEKLFGEVAGEVPVGSPVLGGATRRQSVRNGLEALAADPPDHVLIHD